MLLGREDLVHYALLNNSPYEDTLGRSQKVGKEEIVGMIKALELYLAEDHDALAREWQQRLDTVSKQIAKVPGVSTSFFTPDLANHVPHMQITWDAKISLTVPQATQILRNGSPPIAVGGGEGRPGLAINSFMLQPGEERIVGDQLVKLFRDHAG
jgi:L-seryl-tRNA(Ser) seleniumtransferase